MDVLNRLTVDTVTLHNHPICQLCAKTNGTDRRQSQPGALGLVEVKGF